ncbi:hypothetical protein ES705_23331 [subsurface metagenome]
MMRQKQYDKWSLSQPIDQIENLNLPVLYETEKKLITEVKPSKILDIGCGNGKRLFSYLESNNIAYVGIEKFIRLFENSPYRESIIEADILEVDDTNPQLEDIDCITILGGSLNGIFGFDNHKRAWEKIVKYLPINGKILFDTLLIDGFDTEQELGEKTIKPNITPPQFFLSQNQLQHIWTGLNIEKIKHKDENISAPYKLRYYLLIKTK